MKLRGHRTHILVYSVLVPLALRTSFLPPEAFVGALLHWGALLGGAAALLYGSKRGDSMLQDAGTI